MCDRIQCDRPVTHFFINEHTGERIELCTSCIEAYDRGEEIAYAPKDGRRITQNGEV